MNLLLLPDTATEVELDPRDPRLEHVRGVLRRKEGDTIDVAATNGPRGKATIRTITAKALHLTIIWEANRPPPPPPIHLLVGLCRPQTVKKIVTEATTLGVRSIGFFPAVKSDPAFARSRLWTAEEWRASRQLGAEQAFDSFLPTCALHVDLGAALEATPPDAFRVATDVYEATGPLLFPNNSGKKDLPVVLAFGPERGWGAPDRRALRKENFSLCSLGNRVLRIETAITVGLSLLHRHFGTI